MIKSIPVKEAVEAYLTEKQSLSSFSPTTIKNRRNLLGRLERHLTKVGVKHLKDLHKQTLLDFIDSMKLSVNSKIVIMESLRSFFDYAVDNELILDNLIDRLKIPKKIRIEQSVLFDDEIGKTIDSVIDNSGEYEIDRNLLIMTIFLKCGLRLAELANLDISDIDRINRLIRVVRKGGNIVNIPFNEQIYEYLLTWLQKREEFRPANDALFVTTKGKGKSKDVGGNTLAKRMSVRAIQKLVRKYLQLADLEKAWTQKGPHVLRRSATTDWFKNGVDIKTVQEMLGHRDIRTTEVYAKTHLGRMRSAVEGRIEHKARSR